MFFGKCEQAKKISEHGGWWSFLLQLELVCVPLRHFTLLLLLLEAHAHSSSFVEVNDERSTWMGSGLTPSHSLGFLSLTQTQYKVRRKRRRRPQTLRIFTLYTSRFYLCNLNDQRMFDNVFKDEVILSVAKSQLFSYPNSLVQAPLLFSLSLSPSHFTMHSILMRFTIL